MIDQITVPTQYQTSLKVFDAYQRGWTHGQGIACHNVPTLGDKVWTESMGEVTVDKDNIKEVHMNNCFAAEENSRSYSPFEFTASEFNAAGEFDCWRVSYGHHEDVSEETYETEQEASAAAASEGWLSTDIIFCPSHESLWEAFEAGTSDAIIADLDTYSDDDYEGDGDY
jgi:hypothetical protein